MVLILSALWGIMIRGLWKLPDGRDWLWGKLGLVLNGRAMLGRSLIQFSVDEPGYVPMLFDLLPDYGWGNDKNGNLLQKIPCVYCYTQWPQPCSRWPPTHASAVTNLDSILKSRDITLPTKVSLVKAMVFPVVMYGCESWTTKKAECWRIDAFELWD